MKIRECWKRLEAKEESKTIKSPLYDNGSLKNVLSQYIISEKCLDFIIRKSREAHDKTCIKYEGNFLAKLIHSFMLYRLLRSILLNSLVDILKRNDKDKLTEKDPMLFG